MTDETMLSEGTNSEQQEENLVEIESLDELDFEENQDTQEFEEVSEPEEEPQQVNAKTAPKLLKERKELKNENQTLKQRLAELEFKAEVWELKAKYWDIDVDWLKEFKTQSQYNNLSLEDAYVLYKAKQPKEERQSNLWVVWSKWVPLVKYISYDRLWTLSQAEYDRARDLISQWKLQIKY